MVVHDAFVDGSLLAEHPLHVVRSDVRGRDHAFFFKARAFSVALSADALPRISSVFPHDIDCVDRIGESEFTNPNSPYTRSHVDLCDRIKKAES